MLELTIYIFLVLVLIIVCFYCMQPLFKQINKLINYWKLINPYGYKILYNKLILYTCLI